MADQQASVPDSMTAVGLVVGRDIAYFASPDERHLDPLTVAVAVGGLLLKRYLDGVTRRLGEHAEQAGSDSVDWLLAQITSVFDGDRDEAQVQEEVADAARRAREAAAGRDAQHLAAAAQAGREALAGEVAALGLPEGRRQAIVDAVAGEGLSLAGAGPRG